MFAKTQLITNEVLHFDVVLGRSPGRAGHLVERTHRKRAVWLNWTLSASLELGWIGVELNLEVGIRARQIFDADLRDW